MKTIICIIIYLFVFFAFGSGLEAQEDRIEKLRKKILENQKIIEQLEERTEEQEEKAGEYAQEIVKKYLEESSVAHETEISAGYDKGFFLQTADGSLKFRLNGYIRYHLFMAESNTRQNNTFQPTETRLDFRMFFTDNWHARLQVNFAGGDLGEANFLADGYIENSSIPGLNLRIGQFITPFSPQLQTYPPDFMVINFTPFILAGGVPFREIGVMAHGWGIPFVENDFLSNHFKYALGVFNGDNFRKVNQNDDVEVIGSIRFHPLGAEEKNVYFHLAAFYNKVDNLVNGAAIRLPAFINPNQFAFANVGADNVADVDGTVTGVDAAVTYWKDNLRFEGEFVWVHQERQGASQLNTYGASGAVSYLFSLGDVNFGRYDHPMGLEPVFRLSYTTIEDQNGDGTGGNGPGLGVQTDVRGQDVWEIVVGAKLHFSKHIRFDFNWVMYDLTENEINDAAVGTNSDRGAGGGLLHSFVFQFLARF